MTYEEIQMRAKIRQGTGRAKGKIVDLGESDKVEAGDYIEWAPGAWTDIDPGSAYVGQTPLKGKRFVRIV